MSASSSKSRCSTSACNRKGRPAGGGGRLIGRVEEYFLETLAPGDTFIFAGEVLRFEGIRETAAYVTRTHDPEAQVPSYMGGKFPLSTFLAGRVREMLADPEAVEALPASGRRMAAHPETALGHSQARARCWSNVSRAARKNYLVCYPFEGRLAHQTLGMLVTRRLERLRMRPLGFVANEYALAVWGLRPMGGLDMGAAVRCRHAGRRSRCLAGGIGALQAHLQELRHRRRPDPEAGHRQEKTGRQVTFSSDLIYDVLREHEPDHILLRATYADAATGLLDIARLSDMLARVTGAHRRARSGAGLAAGGAGAARNLQGNGGRRGP